MTLQHANVRYNKQLELQPIRMHKETDKDDTIPLKSSIKLLNTAFFHFKLLFYAPAQIIKPNESKAPYDRLQPVLLQPP